MRWNLRLAAANRGIWKASEMQHLLAEHGLVISAGKMSGLWSGQPASIKLDDLDVICVVLGQSYLGGAQVVKVSPWSPHPSRERCEDGGGWANSRLRSVSLLEGWNRQ